jgi:asparagine synthase (glutamine-hydrolysing)
MCGIAGVVHTSEAHDPPSVELLRSMVTAIRHRGPDEYGYYRDTRAGLVHARLSLIDLTTGQQPLTNEEENLWIVFNGEIFNYIELRKDLEELGHRFRTQSDTEVILHAFESWGEECFSRFNGQWALALWDAVTRKLLLSRDRVGVRPLYTHESGGRVWFASEVKALFADPRIPREIDPRGMEQTFTYWSSLAPVTLFKGIEEVSPGSVRIYDGRGNRSERVFWRPSYAAAGSGYPLSLPEATEALREKLQRATELRILRADVPVGSYLSGGLDSSLTALMGRKAKQGDFRTFSLRFTDKEFDETQYQRMMVSVLDSAHEEVSVSRSDVARVFPDVVWHTERPILRTAPAPMYLLSGIVRQAGIKAVLTGEGADEMLAGYDIFREAKIRMFWSRLPDSQTRPRLFERIYPYLARSPQQTKGIALQFWKRGLERAGMPGFSHDPRWSTTRSIQRFFSTEFRDAIAKSPLVPDAITTLPQAFSSWDPLAQAQYLEVTTLLSSYLISSQGDRMLMAHSVEGRFPFLDADVMEFCNGLPADYKLAILDEKHILKRVAADVVPEPIVRRKKQAYRAPDAICFVGPDAPAYVAEAFSPEHLSSAGLFDVGSARGLYQKCIARAGDMHGDAQFSNTDNMAFVGILSAQLMHRQFICEERSASSAGIIFTTAVDRTPDGRTRVPAAGARNHPGVNFTVQVKGPEHSTIIDSVRSA